MLWINRLIYLLVDSVRALLHFIDTLASRRKLGVLRSVNLLRVLLLLTLLFECLFVGLHLFSLGFVAHSLTSHSVQRCWLKPSNRQLPFFLQFFFKFDILRSRNQETFCDLMHVRMLQLNVVQLLVFLTNSQGLYR